MSRIGALLHERLSEGFGLWEWHEAKAQKVDFPSATLARHGAYLLARQPGVPALWASLLGAREAGAPLVLLGTGTPAEEAVLLRHLPASPPPGAALVLFTSGTTGDPKAVFHGEDSLLASATQLASALPSRGATASLLLPWSMAGVVFHCLLPAVAGARAAYFSPDPFHAWCPHALSLFRDAGIELLTLNPFLLEMYLRSSAGPEWRGDVVSLTAPLKPTLAAAYRERAGQPVREIYGLTEAAGPVLLEGKSLGAEARLPGREGELELKGKQLLLGLGIDGAFQPAPEWLGTGDVFRRDGEHLVHTARSRELLDLGGRKIPPRLLEEVLERSPWVAECLAFPVELGGVERPALLYVRKRGLAMTREELARAVEGYVQRELSAELRPRWWGEVDALPRGKTGKPDRRQALGLYRSMTAS